MVVHQLNVLLGTVQGRRLYEGITLSIDPSAAPLEEAYVSKLSMKKFWGPECEHLGSKAFMLCQTQRFIMFKTKRQAPAEQVIKGETAVVPYDPNAHATIHRGQA